MFNLLFPPFIIAIIAFIFTSVKAVEKYYGFYLISAVGYFVFVALSIILYWVEQANYDFENKAQRRARKISYIFRFLFTGLAIVLVSIQALISIFFFSNIIFKILGLSVFCFTFLLVVFQSSKYLSRIERDITEEAEMIKSEKTNMYDE